MALRPTRLFRIKTKLKSFTKKCRQVMITTDDDIVLIFTIQVAIPLYTPAKEFHYQH